MADLTSNFSALPKSVLNFKNPFGSDTLTPAAPTRKFGADAPVVPPVAATPAPVAKPTAKAAAPTATPKKTPFQLAMEESQADYAPYMTTLETARAASQEAQAKLQKAQSDVELSVLESKAAEAQNNATKQREIFDKQQSLKQEHPAFVPDVNNLTNLGKLFSLITTLGVMSGGGGKLGAQNAMAAMTGMLKGYNEGNVAEFNRQKAIYDENFRAIEAHNADIEKDIRELMRLQQTDSEAAAIQREMIIRKNGSQSIVSAQLEAGKTGAAFETAQAQLKMAEAARAQVSAAEIAAEKNAATLRAAQIRASAEVEAAKQRAAGTGSGATKDAYGFGDIVAVASNEAAASIQNIVMMPANVTTGWFGQGQPIQNLFLSPLNGMVNSLTDESVQRYNAEINNIGKFIAQIQKGGRSVTNADIQNSAKAFAIAENDKPLTVLTKLAQARQALERAIDVKIKSEKTTDALKEIYRRNKQEITQAIPFTVADVNRYASQEDGEMTFADYFKQVGFGNQDSAPAASTAPASTAGRTGKTASGTTYTIED